MPVPAKHQRSLRRTLRAGRSKTSKSSSIAAAVTRALKKQVSMVPSPRAPVLLTSRPIKPQRQPAPSTSRAEPAELFDLSVCCSDIFPSPR